MNQVLKQLVKDNEVGFADIFEAYAALCVDNIRDITEDMIRDEGVAVIDAAEGLSTEALTAHAVDWGQSVVWEMMSDELPVCYGMKENETFMDFVIRAYIEKHVKDTKSFQIKLS